MSNYGRLWWPWFREILCTRAMSVTRAGRSWSQDSWGVMQATFRTSVDVGKLEIREFLQKVYNLPVISIDTAIIYGKKKNVEAGRTRMLTKNPDFKKVWVKFAPGRLFPSLTPESK